MISDDAAWLMIYSGILALRFHPKNITEIRGDNRSICEYAAGVADLGLIQYRKRYGGSVRQSHSDVGAAQETPGGGSAGDAGATYSGVRG